MNSLIKKVYEINRDSARCIKFHVNATSQSFSFKFEFKTWQTVNVLVSLDFIQFMFLMYFILGIIHLLGFPNKIILRKF